MPLLGVLMDDGLTSLGMVSPWMNNGNLVAFLHKNAISTSARLQLVSVRYSPVSNALTNSNCIDVRRRGGSFVS